MFVTSTRQLTEDQLIRADFTGRFLILTRIDLTWGLPSIVQFRCSSLYLKDIIDSLQEFDGTKVIDNNYDVPVILHDRQHIKALYVAGQALEFYNLPALLDVLLSVYEQNEALEVE